MAMAPGLGHYGMRMVLAVMVMALAAGCNAPLNPRDDAKFQSYAYTADRPVVRPVRSMSSFSPSLMCMDRMLREAQAPTMLITSKQIPDYSGRVAVDAKDMVITALSQMSRLSNAFRYVDYEVDIARQDTVQNLTTILLNNNQMQLQRPALYFSGAIAFADQNVLNNRLDAGVSGPRVDMAYSRTRNATVIGLEMHIGDFRTRTLIPGLDSANEVIVGASSQGVDLAGRIGAYGVQFNVGRDYTQGAGAGVRTLVDLAAIELVGKWARLPYWQCLTLEQAHPDFQRQLRDWYDDGAPAAHHQLVRRSLISRGYLSPQDEQAADNGITLRNAIARFQADQGIVVTGVVDFTTYERALRDFVAIGDDGSLVRVGWNTTSGVPIATTTGPAATPAYGSPPPPRTIDMQVRNVLVNRTAFEVGEQIFLTATVSRASHFYCYYADAKGTVIRLLPNNTNRTTWVSANQAVRIPDWMSPSPGFIMDASSPGTEGVACFASDEDSLPRLPASLQGPALTPIPGYPSLENVNQAFSQVWGGAGYTGNAVYWQVIPKRESMPRK